MVPRPEVFPRSFVRALVVAGAIVLVLTLLAVFTTRDLMLLLFGLGVVGYLGVVALARWVYVDANARGGPGGAWAVAMLVAPILALVAYLVVRELRGR